MTSLITCEEWEDNYGNWDICPNYSYLNTFASEHFYLKYSQQISLVITALLLVIWVLRPLLSTVFMTNLPLKLELSDLVLRDHFFPK